ncbi:transketolase [bacterium]|nr:transketolase [bacterium]
MVINAPHPLQSVSQKLRLSLLNLVHDAGESHIGGPLSSLDLMTSLYFSKLFNFKKDHFILSAGHLAPALYVVLAQAGYFPKTRLKDFSTFGSHLQGHSSADTPGVEYSSGALGQGLSFAAGLALGDPNRYSVCLTTDGEHQEGQIWEAAMFAKKYKLSNLINIIDHNQYQIDGAIEDIMPLGNLAQKYIKFGWAVTTVNGHNFKAIAKALKNAKKKSTCPSCIIAKTIFAKGVSFMQYDYRYHDIKNLSPAQYQRAKKELETSP